MQVVDLDTLRLHDLFESASCNWRDAEVSLSEKNLDEKEKKSGFLSPVPTNRMWTVPNALTLARIALLPVFLLWLSDERYLAACFLYGFIAMTDFFDGKIARRFDQVSHLGTMMDPVADRLLILAGALGTVTQGLVPVWLIVLLLARELTVSLWTIYLQIAGVQIAVRMIGKVAATFVFFSLPAFVGAEAFDPGTLARSWLLFQGYACGVAGIFLGSLTNLQYFSDGRAAIASARSSAPGSVPG